MEKLDAETFSLFFPPSSSFFFFEALNLDAVHQEPLVLPPHKNKNKTVTLFSLAARSNRRSSARARVALSPVKNSIFFFERGSSPKTEGLPASSAGAKVADIFVVHMSRVEETRGLTHQKVESHLQRQHQRPVTGLNQMPPTS